MRGRSGLRNGPIEMRRKNVARCSRMTESLRRKNPHKDSSIGFPATTGGCDWCLSWTTSGAEVRA